MDNISIVRAFASFGADSAQQRSLSAVAADGSLVLVCQSGGFSRPGVGVLRYTAQLSTAPLSRLAVLRTHISEAHSAGTIVRLIIETLKTAKSSARAHVRPDLVGKVTGFDGNEYMVDFSRPQPPPAEPKSRRATRTA